MFSQIMAGVNCLSIPFGLLLGVFTLIVLARPSVKALYAEHEQLHAGGRTPLTYT